MTPDLSEGKEEDMASPAESGGTAPPKSEGLCKSELLPCPFCGSTGEEVALCGHLRLSGHHDGWNVRCYVCHVETGYEDTQPEAIAAWNRRALPEPAHGSSEPVTDGLDLDALEKVTEEPTAAWRCFQCDAVFTDRREAEGHFGRWSHHSPACMAGETFQTLKTAYNHLEADFFRMKARAEERDNLHLAICGGEDAPGYAASLSHEQVLGVLADNYASARRDAELAWDGETANTWKSRALAAEAALPDQAPSLEPSRGEIAKIIRDMVIAAKPQDAAYAVDEAAIQKATTEILSIEGPVGREGSSLVSRVKGAAPSAGSSAIE